eukprot:6698-Heterococcus_DN1.PRE.1
MKRAVITARDARPQEQSAPEAAPVDRAAVQVAVVRPLLLSYQRRGSSVTQQHPSPTRSSSHFAQHNTSFEIVEDAPLDADAVSFVDCRPSRRREQPAVSAPAAQK